MKVNYKAVFRRCSEESGAALLIALGFLVLMMVVGIAFVSTSLFSRKLAANSDIMEQTRTLARSAAARAEFNIMLCFDQANALTNLDAASSYDEVNCNDNGTITPAAVLDDQLKSTSACSTTKLDYHTGTTDYSGDQSSAKWLYYYDAPAGTTPRRIIGRTAFQVLPEQPADLSLYGVMGGSVIPNSLGVIPQTFRWGRGIEELAYNSSTGLHGCNPADAAQVPYTFDMLYSAFSGFDDPAIRKWVETWFAEGKNTIAREVFPALDAADHSGKKLLYFNRFNIGDFYYTQEERNAKDNWYDRFNWGNSAADRKNSDVAVEALSKDALESCDDDTSDIYLVGYGLPFLRRIGNDKYSFSTLDLLRRQIVANFNDYCDTDDIPTSDIPSSEWNVTDLLPAYTGNEKTLYINEVGVEIGAPVLDFSAENLNLESVPVRLVGEVVNMYDNSVPAETPLLDPANVELTLGLKKLSFNVKLNCTYKGKVTYEVTSPHGYTMPYVKDFGPINLSKVVNVSLTGAPECTIGGASTAFSSLANGYAVGAGTAIKDDHCTITSTGNYFSSAIKDAAKAAMPAGGKYKSHRMTDVQVGYQLLCDANSQVEFTPALLKAKSSVSGDAAGKGLDFVRFDRTGPMTLQCNSGAVGWDKAVLFYSHGDDSKWRFATTHYVCGIEARDPRQNLNPDYGTPATSDWNLVPEIVMWSDHPSMIVEANPGSDQTRPYLATGGKCNRGANPSAPKYLDAGSSEVAVADVDTETATDPAWLGDAAGQHVSTAYIRNSPMVSAWELGLIHRGREWQTLNIKKAGGFNGAASITLDEIKSKYDWDSAPGTTYAAGDGAILDFIKLGVNCRAMGKLQLKQLSTDAITASGVNPEYSKDLVKMLFDTVRVGQTMKQFYTETKFGAAAVTGGSAVSTSAAVTTDFVSAVDGLVGASPEFLLRSQFLNTAYGESGTTFGLAQSANDALQEELIGKTANLLAVQGTTPGNIYRVLIVAQSIKDVGGVGSEFTLIKGDGSGGTKTLKCLLGRFDFIKDADDWRKNLYFDEIIGETKALVTIERVPAADGATPNSNYGQMVVTSIEFL